MKRSAKWAVVREKAPTMPWEDGSLPSALADTLKRMAAIRGTAAMLSMYCDSLELQGRLDVARGIGAPLTPDEAAPIILQHYHELVETEGHEYAQRFVRLWLALSDHLVAVEKGAIARAALKKQLARGTRR